MRGTCDACGYGNDGDGTPVEEYGPEFGDLYRKLGRRPRFCEVCASTFISKVETDPEAMANPLAFYRSIARIANMILDGLHELKTGSKR